MSRDEERELKDVLAKAHRTLDPDPPSFEATLRAARLRGRGRPRWRMATTLAAVLLLLVGLGFLARGRSVEPDPAEALRLAESLSSWRGPTEFLGRAPGAELLATLPQLDRTLSMTTSSAVALTLAAEHVEETP